MAGCATPKLYVPESELPKIKFVVVEVATYDKFELKDEEFTFTGPTNEEYGSIFKEAFEKELKYRGFAVFSLGAEKKNRGDFLLIKVSLSHKSPLVPLIVPGSLVFSATVENRDKVLWRLDGTIPTNPPITSVSSAAKIGLVRGLIREFTKSF